MERTFLFTDIEGSTRLWEEHPDQMSIALARHDALLRQAIEGNGGEVFKTIGDAFCAAFSCPDCALQAALDAQHALKSEDWPEPVAIKARMAIHRGPAEERDADYFGPALNKVARILAVAHGEQIVVSEELPGTSLKDLGLHRLKDLQQPVQIWQVQEPGLREEFPPLRSLQSYSHNLPAQLSSFVGREREMADVKRLLKENHLLTLTGVGGCGKTRLTLQAGADLLEDFAQGVWLVELAALSEPAFVPQAVADALGVREEPGKPLVQTLTDFIKSRNILLILDNCEHLLGATAGLTETLLRACPKLWVLASSREVLGIVGEAVYSVPSLSLPKANVKLKSHELIGFESIRLFVERAQAIVPSFEITPSNADSVRDICTRLDGIPLALELAAVRVRALTPDQIASRLNDRFRLLTGGSRTALPRQQTLRALIDWSYSMLTEEEKTLFARLAVFSGGWSIEVAELVCTGGRIGQDDILTLMSSLADKSLIVADVEGLQARYRLLETMRQYARERLAEAGEEPRLRELHLQCFLVLAERAQVELTGPEQADWLELLDSEHDNLRAALEYGDGPEALRLCAALWPYWEIRGHLSEGRSWCSAVLWSAMTQEPTLARAKALNGAGMLAYRQADHTKAIELFEESLAIYRDLDNRPGLSTVLNNLGIIHFEGGKYDEARGFYQESLAIRRELGDKKGVAGSLNNLGIIAFELRDYATATAMHTESLAIKREMGNTLGAASSLINLGNVEYDQQHYGPAADYYNQALDVMRGLGHKRGVAICLGNIAVVNLESGDAAAARPMFMESLELIWDLGDQHATATTLGGIAALLSTEGEHLKAATIWGAEEALRERIGAPMPLSESERQEVRVSAAKEAAGEGPFDAAWLSGRLQPLDEIVSIALR